MTSLKQILIVILLLGVFGPAVPEESSGPVLKGPALRPVQLSSQPLEPSAPSIEPWRALASQESDDYTSTLVGGPLMLAFFYAIVSYSARPDRYETLG